jgi:hypothetical protein
MTRLEQVHEEYSDAKRCLQENKDNDQIMLALASATFGMLVNIAESLAVLVDREDTE